MKRGQPATFKVGGVIPGWTEALQLMKAGSKWQLYVPSILLMESAARDARSGQMRRLIFEVELLSFRKMRANCRR